MHRNNRQAGGAFLNIKETVLEVLYAIIPIILLVGILYMTVLTIPVEALMKLMGGAVMIEPTAQPESPVPLRLLAFESGTAQHDTGADSAESSRSNGRKRWRFFS